MSIAISVLIFLGVLFVVITVHELGHFFAFRGAGVAIKELGLGFPPRLLAIKRGETEYSINLIPLGAFVMPVGDESPISPGSLATKSPWVRVWVNLAGPLANMILAFVLLTANFMLPVRMVVGGGGGAEIAQVAEGSPAAMAGIQSGDVLLDIDGERIETTEEMHRIVSQAADLEVPVTLRLLRGGEERYIILTPRHNPPEGEGALGINYKWLPSPVDKTYIEETYQSSFWEAGYLSGVLIINTPVVLKDSLMSGNVQLVGPVGAGQMTVEVVGRDLSAVVFMAGLISIGIGFFNLFPIPPLDGGGVVVALIEGVRRGKRLSPKGTRIAYAIGTALLITLFLVITSNDVLRLIRGQSLIP